MNPALMNPNALAMLAMQAQMMGSPMQQQAAPQQMMPQQAPGIPMGLMVPPSPTASGRMRAAIQRGAKRGRQSGAAR